MKPLLIFIAFALAAILGTLQHEMGHYIVIRSNGYDARIHYGYTSIPNSSNVIATAKRTHTEPLLIRQFTQHKAGGPAMTMLTGIIGLIGLYTLRRRTVIDAYNSAHLFVIILSLFWSRELCIAVYGLISHYVLRNTYSNADEHQLMLYNGIPFWIGYGLLLAISFALCWLVCFRLVQKHRWQLFFYGIAGSVAGAALWFVWLGPVLLP